PPPAATSRKPARRWWWSRAWPPSCAAWAAPRAATRRTDFQVRPEAPGTRVPGASAFKRGDAVKSYARAMLLGLLAGGLAWSFWASAGWLQLCAGLALFLFGMQCLEEGLRQLAGGKLEQLLGRSTATPGKAMLFGMGGTLLLQSSTLVSLLTIAFISTGLIQLAGGIAILFGANLGATSGIWLLALAGQNLSLSPLALP